MVATNQRARLQTCMLFYFVTNFVLCFTPANFCKAIKAEKKREKGCMSREQAQQSWWPEALIRMQMLLQGAEQK